MLQSYLKISQNVRDRISRVRRDNCAFFKHACEKRVIRSQTNSECQDNMGALCIYAAETE